MIKRAESPFRLLLTHAIAAEKINVFLPNTAVHYCQTEVGKVNAAVNVFAALTEMNNNGGLPQLVLNIGTAGSVSHAVGSILACADFYDRDMARLKEFGIIHQHDFSAAVKNLTHEQAWLAQLDIRHTCNTGDSFVTEPIDHADVVDMENFATAVVCARLNIPLLSIKYITDKIGENSIAHWQEQLDQARTELQVFFDHLAALAHPSSPQ